MASRVTAFAPGRRLKTVAVERFRPGAQLKEFNPDQSRRADGRFGSGGASSSGGISEYAKGRATELHDKAAAAEPAITSGLSGIAKAQGGEMTGLAFRLKAEPDVAEKIGRVAEERGVSEKVASETDLRDINRYTMTFSPENYAAGTSAAMADMQKAGFVPLKGSNTWAEGNVYRGFNTQWQTKGWPALRGPVPHSGQLQHQDGPA